ncbi:MAG: hypothetical protein KY459_09920 [Acidobacteria bacterium]|nr:hypothetical protein [Acidobacteriota bacterium]
MRSKNRSVKENQKGSALLVSLMVMVGLTLLGLGFVAVSETESAISVNERNYLQTLQVAEAGTRTVAEWFNGPDWAIDNGIMPVNNAANEAAFKKERHTGDFYRPWDDEEMLFDSPFTASTTDRFYGVDEESADILIDRSNQEGRDFLDNFNDVLFHDPESGGQVTRIAIYAPPIVGSTIVTHTNGFDFHDGGTRYGIATIAVQSEKHRAPDDLTTPLISTRTVKAVVGEFPFPGPDGPLQSNAGISQNGAFRVHWGKVISLGDLGQKRYWSALPWVDAWDEIKYEHGYDPYYDDGTTPDYFYQLIGKTFEDPWYQARARGNLTYSGGTPAMDGTTQPWLYDSITDDENGTVDGAASGYSGQFQGQIQDNPPNLREVIFTRPVYTFWKQIAMTGATQQGINYLRYNAGTGQYYNPRGESRDFRGWVDTLTTGEEGFFFFDTTTAANPQNADGSTNESILTPQIKLQGNDLLMRGFIYVNSTELEIAGLNGPDYWYNAPFEPFRDEGFQEYDTVTGTGFCHDPLDATNQILCSTSPGANPWKVNYTNYKWDYQDLNDNDRFDIVVALGPPTNVVITDGGTTTTLMANSVYLPVPYSDACGTANIGTTCSDPHEPYLNLIQPATLAQDSNGVPAVFQVGWEPPGSETRMPKVHDNQVEVTCSAGSSQADCTSNAYDRVGPLMKLDPNKGPILDGVMYNEGKYGGTGNPIYYGSLLIWGLVGGSGTPDIFFDGRLAQGDWEDRFENLPRTIISSMETDL